MSTWVYKVGFFTPLLLIIIVSLLHFDLVQKRSEDKILAIWKQQPEAEQSDLFYLHKRPFSGQYYSSGKAKQRSTDLGTWLPIQNKNFFIVQSTKDHTKYADWSCNERDRTQKEALLFCKANK